MRSRCAFFAAVALALFTVGANALPGEGLAQDVQPPALLSMVVDPPTVYLKEGLTRVEVRCVVADDLSGVLDVSLSFLMPGPLPQAFGVAESFPIPALRRESTLSVFVGHEFGAVPWLFQELTVRDHQLNARTYESLDLQEMGLPQGILVVDELDPDAEPPSVDVTGVYRGPSVGPGGDVQLTARLEQDGSEVSGSLQANPRDECLGDGVVSGLVRGNRLGGTVREGDTLIDFGLEVHDGEILGNFQFASGCYGTSIVQQVGTVRLARVPPPRCIGDCNEDSTVTVDEILTQVSLSLGTLPPEACVAGDGDLDMRVSTAEIMDGVTQALGGCPS